jgi:hypothetical protein
VKLLPEGRKVRKNKKRLPEEERREFLENLEAHKGRATKRTKIYDLKNREQEDELKEFLDAT